MRLRCFGVGLNVPRSAADRANFADHLQFAEQYRPPRCAVNTSPQYAQGPLTQVRPLVTVGTWTRGRYRTASSVLLGFGALGVALSIAAWALLAQRLVQYPWDAFPMKGVEQLMQTPGVV